MADPWALKGDDDSSSGYMDEASFRSTMDSVYGPGNWRATGGWRSQARENQLRAQGAMTTRPGVISAHSRGTQSAPGAWDIQVNGMTPQQAAAKLRGEQVPVGQVLPEGPHGSQGAHLHVGMVENAKDPWAMKTGDARKPDPWAMSNPWSTAPTGKTSKRSLMDTAADAVSTFAGGMLESAGQAIRGFGGLADIGVHTQADVESRGGRMIDPITHMPILSAPTPAEQLEQARLARSRTPIVMRAVEPAAKALVETGRGLQPEDPNLADRVVGGAGSFVPAVGAFALDPIAGAATFGAQGYGGTYEEARRKGASEADAQNAAAENAALQASLGLVPVGRVLAPVTRAIERPVVGAIARTAVAAGGNAVLGGTMQVGSNIVAQQNYDPERGAFDNVPESALEMGLAGGLIHAGGEGIDALRARRAARAGAEQTSEGAPAAEPMPETTAADAYAAMARGRGVEGEVPVDGNGFAMTGDRAPMRFQTQREAAEYMAANRMGGGFDIENHPDGGFGVKRRAGMDDAENIPPAPPPEYEQARHAEGAPVEEMPDAVADVAKARATPDGHPEAEAEMAQAEVVPEDTSAVAAAKLAAYRASVKLQTGDDMAALRRRAEHLGVPQVDGQTFDELLSDVVSHEAALPTYDGWGADHDENQVDAVLTPDEHERLASAKAGARGEQGATEAAAVARRAEGLEPEAAPSDLEPGARARGDRGRAPAIPESVELTQVDPNAIVAAWGQGWGPFADRHNDIRDAMAAGTPVAIPTAEFERTVTGQPFEPHLRANVANLDPNDPWAIKGEELLPKAKPKAETGPIRPETGELDPGESYVATPAGNRIRVRQEVVALDDLVPATGDLQNRDRTRASTDIQIQDIISNFDPSRLGDSAETDRGAPIIGPDNVVESGNGRVLVLTKIYADPKLASRREAYERFLMDQGVDFAGVDKPVLVRRNMTPMTPEQRRQFVIDSNKDTKLALTAVEKARSDADVLDGETLDLYRGGDVATAANADFVKAFMARMPEGERSALFDANRQLSQEGVKRIENALMARAYGDPQLIAKLMEARDNNIRSIGTGMLDQAAAWAKLRAGVEEGDVKPGFDVTKQLVAAANRVSDARSRGEKIDDVLSQADVFNPMDPVTEGFIRAFYTKDMVRAAGRDAIADVLGRYARRAMEQAGEPDLLGRRAPVTAEQILHDALGERANGDRGADLFEVGPALFQRSHAALGSLYARETPFYSAAARAIENSTTKAATPAQWKATLDNAQGVKREELEWTGVKEWLDLFPEGEKVPKDKVAAFMREHGVKVSERVLGGTSPHDNRSIEERAEEIYDHAVAAKVEAMQDSARWHHHDEETLQEVARESVSYDDAYKEAERELAEPETEYSDWKEPGGEDYHELLLTLPDIANPPATHWDTEGVMAHVRFDTRQSPDGKKVLFVEEVQSDWHQKGRDHGYAKAADLAEQKAATEAREAASAAQIEKNQALVDAADKVRHLMVKRGSIGLGKDPDKAVREAPWNIGYHPDIDARDGMRTARAEIAWRWLSQVNHDLNREELAIVHPAMMAWRDAELRRNEAQQRYDQAHGSSGIANAPFKSSWPALVMKRVIAWAADHGFDRVAWTTGAQQIERYNLGERVGDLDVARHTPESKVEVTFTGNPQLAEQVAAQFQTNQSKAATVELEPAQLRELFGKDLADHIVRHANAGGTRIPAPDVKIGGGGMRAFYDRNLVNITNDIIKKYGAKVRVGPGDLRQPDRARIIGEYLLGSPEAARAPLSDVDAAVGALRHHDQVREAIARALPVDVVDALTAHGVNTEQFIRQPQMFLDHLPAEAAASVMLGLRHALSEVGARLGAGLDAAYQAGLNREVIPALYAGEIDPVSARDLWRARKGGAARGAESEASSVGGEAGRAALADFGEWHDRIRRQRGSFDLSQNPQFEITEKMREAATNGFPLFKAEKDAGTGLGESQQPTPEQAKLVDAVHAIIQRIAPKAAIRAFGSLQDAAGNRVLGAQWREGAHQVIAWSLESRNPAATGRHEALHALRNAGLFKPEEWDALEAAALEHGWTERYGTADSYSDFPPEIQIEEAIAERFADWAGDRTQVTDLPSFVRALFERIWRVLQAVKAAVRKALGADVTAADVFAAMERGDIGKRTERASRRETVLFERPKGEAFDRWFGKSKVVDKNGAPLVVYHGTEKAGFDTFDESHRGDDGGRRMVGYYFTESPTGAATYSGTSRPARVSAEPDFDARYDGERGNYAVYLKIEDPLVVDFEGRGWDGSGPDDHDDYFNMDRFAREAKAAGHDGLIAKNVNDEGRYGQGYGWDETTYVVFDPKQIKSADQNSGTYDPADPRILFQRERAEKKTRGIINRMLGEGVDAVGAKLNKSVARFMSNDMVELAHNIRMGTNPMAAGAQRAKALAKDFANALRLHIWEWRRVDEWIEKNFDREARARMWEAADEESVIRQQGGEPGPHEGLNALDPAERAAVDELQRRANVAFNEAKRLGMTAAEGLPSYVPRMVVEMTEGGARRPRGNGPGSRQGANLHTSTGNMRQRKHMTTEETEAAAKERFGEDAMVIKDIRTLAFATGRLEQAIAGRKFINEIKASGNGLGKVTVTEGGTPDPAAAFTLDHPAFRVWRPMLHQDPATGKIKPIINPETGKPVFEAVPLWVDKEYEGPITAVLSSPSGPIVRFLTTLKAKAMSVIMYTPLIHNAVIWGKAIPAAPTSVLFFTVYFKGNKAKNDPATMREALYAGLDPIGKRYFNQDITALLEGPQIEPGRSWTAKLLAAVPGLVSKEWGTVTKAAVDKLGDVWHNTFLWDRVADLQMGLYTIMRDSFVKHGNDPLTAQRAAAHFANRYAGALPIEAMSKLARNFANLALFSRSFTFTNIGAWKDVLVGLPGDVQAQIERDRGLDALKRVQGTARGKAIGLLIMDIALAHIGLILAAWAVYELHQWLNEPQDYQSPSENEPDKTNRFLIGYDNDGTALYGRLPTGKVGEDLQDWVTEPVGTGERKLSPFAKVALQIASNDKGFGRKLYDPNDYTPAGYAKNLGRVVVGANLADLQGPDDINGGILSSIAPMGLIKGGAHLVGGQGDHDTALMQTILPIFGITVSRGAPGGPAAGEFFNAKDEQNFKVNEHMPRIRAMIRDGDIRGAQAEMIALKMPGGLRSFTIRTTRNPAARLSGRKLADFMRYASPEAKAQFRADQRAAIKRRASDAGATP